MTKCRYSEQLLDRCFALEGPNSASILILGSMPGKKSLMQQQYYAHPQNQFWPIMANWLSFDPALPYNKKLEQLNNAGVLLWDVIAQCQRPGSLDSDIKADSIAVNDFAWLFNQYSINKVLLNGGKAYQLFQRHVVKAGLLPEITTIYKMPSTSPAYAALSKEAKSALWLSALMA